MAEKDKYFLKSQVFVTVLILLVMVFSLGSVFIIYSRSYRSISYQEKDYSLAQFLAESSLTNATFSLKESPCNCANFSLHNLSGGNFTYTINKTYNLSDLGYYRINASITGRGNYGRTQAVLTDSYSQFLRTWKRFYLPAGDNVIWSNMLPTADGGYILTGVENLSKKGVILKVDSQGDIVWQKLYQRSGSTNYDAPTAITRVKDGSSDCQPECYAIAGVFGDMPLVGGDIGVIKLNPQGEILASKSYKSSTFSHYVFNIFFKDDSYYIQGYTNKFLQFYSFIVKLASNLSLDWHNQYKFPSSSPSSASISAILDEEGNILMPMKHVYSSQDKICLVKISSEDGTVIWAKDYSSSGVSPQINYYVTQISEGYILGGTGQNHPVVFKVDKDGNPSGQGTRLTGSLSSELNDYGGRVIPFPGGGFLMSGYSGTQPENVDVYDFLIKFDENLTPQWANSYDLRGSWAGYPISSVIDVTSSGEIIMASSDYINASSQYLFALYRTSSSGNIDCCNFNSTSSLSYQSLTLSDSDININTLKNYSLSESSDYDSLVVENGSYTSNISCPSF